MDIVEFLRVRYDEEAEELDLDAEIEAGRLRSTTGLHASPDATAQSVKDYWLGLPNDPTGWKFRLADLASKRAIVASYEKAVEDSRPSGNPTVWGQQARFGLFLAVGLLAQPYASHVDYDPEWAV